MVVRRDKKSRKMHGYRNRGWGSIGQHRKSGSRGGRGAAGMHKHKWSWVIKYFRDWFGKKGFVPRNPVKTVEVREITLAQIDSLVYRLIKDGKAVYEDGKIVIDLSKMGINKVIGSGRISYPIKLLTYSITEKAREKIEKAGGTVVILKNK
ncbi:LSU ribosomal protein L15P [Ignisphaera aggregans DSM 17230]|uniref:Large ribosomal subunit protein uL15 n=1 Tax=Ignisphaera aggregans (strain DSM 17230 / JCM 13409 / AQ1.S1) TaxID=583356 RepID=E0SQ71_IGNAA|nr:LSU ribosomal protein L15P [Ignisphaera aggregans DSM 17230]